LVEKGRERNEVCFGSERLAENHQVNKKKGFNVT